MSPTRFRCLIPTLSVALMLSVGWSSHALALTKERWTDETPAAAFFNNYDPNFYTGFAPRVQDRRYVTIHTGRGNQVRLRIVLPEEAIETYLPEQTAGHALFKEVIDKDIIELTANSAWEAYDARVTEIGLADLAARRDAASPEEWRQLNLDMMDQLNPGRLYRIQRDFDAMAAELTTALSEALGEAETIDKLEAKLDLINAMMPGRIMLTDLSDERSAAFDELTALAKSRDTAAFRAALEPFFQDITGGIYEIADGKLDFYEFTTIYPVGTYDAQTTYKGRKIPKFVTTGVWTLIPRQHGSGYTGMVDYISSKGYYGVMPMLPYQYAGGTANKSRSANQIWAQNNRDDFNAWLYGDEIIPGPPGEVVVKQPVTCKFVKRKAVEGEQYENLRLYEAPYEPEQLQFYQVKGVDTYSKKAMDFNREMRRVGYGYEIDRAKLLLPN